MTIDLPASQKSDLARGYWLGNTSPSPHQLNKLWGTAGGLKMTLVDLLNYGKLQLESDNPVVQESQRVLFTNGKGTDVAYFWRVRNDKYGTSFNHHGGTIGMQNWLFIFTKYDLAISIITNQSGPKTPKLIAKTAKKILNAVIEIK